MTFQRAMDIIDGWGDPPESEEEVISAYQYMINTGAAWKLPGYVGRACMQMIEEGYCKVPGDYKKEGDSIDIIQTKIKEGKETVEEKIST
tara:strand:- start:323 stop:592 length:270 start_codon:yes stop_codon:yes gene_type:complete